MTMLEELARALTPMFLELTGDYAEVPPEEVWTRPRYEHLKMWFCRLTDSAILPIITREIDRAKAEGWRPIETAPKDGTKFLAWCDAWQGEINGIEYRQFAAITGGKPGKSDQDASLVWWPGDGDAYAVWYRATHWMPPPSPPSIEG